MIQNGFFEFYDSFILNNYAHNNPVSQLFDSPTESIVSHTEIHNNEYLSVLEIETEMVSSCSKLCFLNQVLIDHISNNGILNEDDGGKPIFQLIIASLKIIDNSSIYEQSLIGKAFVSTLSLEDSIISNLTMEAT